MKQTGTKVDQRMLASLFLLAGTNFQVISTAITAVQKCAFVFFVCACLMNGTVFNIINKSLMPEKAQHDDYWIFTNIFHLFNLNQVLKIKPSEDCKSLRDICLDYGCIDSSLLIDDADVLKAISRLSPISKSFYLTVVKGSKFIAPFLIQASLLFTALLVGVLPLVAIKKALQAFEVDPGWARLPLLETLFSENSSARGFNILAVISGFLVTSGLFCLLSMPQSRNKVCDNPWCLYCITSLSQTIFRNFYKSDTAIPRSEEGQLILTIVVYISSVILTLLLYFLTVLFLCLIIYIPLDAASSVWTCGSTLGGIIPGFQATLNKYKPNLNDLVYRLMQRNNIHQEPLANE